MITLNGTGSMHMYHDMQGISTVYGDHELRCSV